LAGAFASTGGRRDVVAPIDDLAGGTAGVSAWEHLADGPSYGELVNEFLFNSTSATLTRQLILVVE
jgi:hypothetical protein